MKEPILHPVWIPFPRDGELCKVSSLPLTALKQLARPCEANEFKPPVKSKKIVTPGQTKGRLMIQTASLLAWFETQESEVGA